MNTCDMEVLPWKGGLGVLGIQSGGPKGLGKVEASLGKGHLGQALMEKGARDKGRK